MRNTPQLDQILENHSAETIIELLAPYITAARQDKINRVVNQRLSGVQVALEHTADPHNLAAVLRSAEAFGLLDIHIITPDIKEVRSHAVTQGAQQWLRLHHYDHLNDFVERKNQLTLHLTASSFDTTQTLDDLPIDGGPICVFMGNESNGLTAEAFAASDSLYTLPMYGMSQSLNLSVATALSMQNLANRRRQHFNGSDLNQAERQRLIARYFLLSVEQRLVDGLLAR